MTTTKTPDRTKESDSRSSHVRTSKGGDTVSKGADRKLHEADVVDFLRSHPDFFITHSDLLETMVTPSRALGDGVTDFQRFMVDKLKTKVQELRDTQQALIAAGQENDVSLGRIHGSALRLVEATSLQELGEMIADDIPALCGIDCALLGLERIDVPNAIVSLPKGMVDLWLGPADAMLHANTQGIPELFGAHAPHVRSFALMRIEPRPELTGVVAFGSRDPECFTPDQGTDLVAFLTGIIARQLNRLVMRAANLQTG